MTGCKYKTISKRTIAKYVTIMIVKNESVSDSFDVALSKNGTHINFADIMNV